MITGIIPQLVIARACRFFLRVLKLFMNRRFSMQGSRYKGYIFSFLALAALLVSALGANFVFAKGAATQASSSAGRTFQSTGHGTIVPRKVSTSSVPQVKGTGHGSVVYRPAPGGYAHVPS